MKKIYGVFRGFPGLGRVSSGIALLKEFQKLGYEIEAVSYFQGTEALYRQGIPLLFEYNIEQCDITSIGINPITGFATKIINKIIENQPDAVIIDGEPLLQSTLCDIYPKERVISLLNPSDLQNDSLPESTIRFYHKNYLSGENAIVHGVGIENEVIKEKECYIHYIPTILRDEIMEISTTTKNTHRIIGILGGGSVNSSDKFVSSTVEMGKKIAFIAKRMPQYSFDVYCNDLFIQSEIEKNIVLPSNYKIISTYTTPSEMYKGAKMVIARAGRNVVSELLYLNIPALLIATSGDYRSKEQEKNIDMMIKVSNNLFDKINILDDEDIMIKKINDKLHNEPIMNKFIPGNNYAVDVICKIMEEHY